MFVFSCYVTIATFIMAQGVISQFIEGNMETNKNKSPRVLLCERWFCFGVDNLKQIRHHYNFAGFFLAETFSIHSNKLWTLNKTKSRSCDSSRQAGLIYTDQQ